MKKLITILLSVVVLTGVYGTVSAYPDTTIGPHSVIMYVEKN